jgi:AraC family transcriptional regulator
VRSWRVESSCLDAAEYTARLVEAAARNIKHSPPGFTYHFDPVQTPALLDLLRDICIRLDRDVSLAALAARSGWSRFHLHRAFRQLAGETPKQYTQRLRLTRAAGTLATTDKTVLEIAIAAGFTSPEVFARAFRRQFERNPAQYRSEAFASASPADRTRHLAVTDASAPCLHLFHAPIVDSPRIRPMSVISITREERAAQPILFIRRRIGSAELQNTLGECFGALFGHAQKRGLAIAGFPLARYVSTGPGLWTVEPAVPLVTPAPGEGELQAGFLQAGPVAKGIHGGPYDELPETNVAIERWIEANGYRVDGPPWEWYVTDPAEHPNPADWRTEVYWPLAQ